MSGHSKWAQIKRQKAATDARKGQTFTKMAREITVAARQGGGDPEANFRLRIAIQKAREVNVPMDNIERAIKRGVGGGEGAALEEITYEGYGPGGAALMITVTTDNRNRAASDIRSVLTRGGGNLGESGSVAWLFEPRGVIIVDTKGKDA
ncbi:MAG: YebC/PmpR family DNA-binding transcriptional regulator, partial [Chloroflexi bacterium]|nr:YebC/PmpR family DNA-binding transcriptional regulator [Chloroflexota bacterium]